MNLRKGFSHQFKSKCQISNFLMKKFKYLDLPQYLFINMISYCCKQKFLYRFFIINMTRNIFETNVINCYWMKLWTPFTKCGNAFKSTEWQKHRFSVPLLNARQMPSLCLEQIEQAIGRLNTEQRLQLIARAFK